MISRVFPNVVNITVILEHSSKYIINIQISRKYSKYTLNTHKKEIM